MISRVRVDDKMMAQKARTSCNCSFMISTDKMQVSLFTEGQNTGNKLRHHLKSLRLNHEASPHEVQIVWHAVKNFAR